MEESTKTTCRRRPRLAPFGCVVVVVAVATAHCATAAPAAQSAETPCLTHVFHHICENPRLEAILRPHEMPQVESLEPAGETLCGVGDFAFQCARIYFELYPASGADELWIADETAPLEPGSIPTLLLRLERLDSVLVIHRGADSPIRVPREPGQEDRLSILLTDGEMSLLDGRQSGTPLLETPLAVRRGLQLLIPSRGASCGREECGLPALDVYLDAEDARRWSDAGLATIE